MQISLPQFSIIRSARRSMVIEIKRDGEILVRIPHRVSDAAAKRFVAANQEKVAKCLEKIQSLPKQTVLDPQQIKVLKKMARELLPPKAAYYAKLLNVEPKHIKITSAKKRFGSCSASHGICFSYLLMQYPQAAIDYVVLHEVAHIVHHNHSKQFYDLIKQHMPDYKQRSGLLKHALQGGEV